MRNEWLMMNDYSENRTWKSVSSWTRRILTDAMPSWRLIKEAKIDLGLLLLTVVQIHYLNKASGPYLLPK